MERSTRIGFFVFIGLISASIAVAQPRPTWRVSVSSAGVQSDGASGTPTISRDGRLIAFYSEGGNLVPGDTNLRGDTFVHDQISGQTSRVSVSSSGVQGDNISDLPMFSPDGRYVVFHSYATNLVAFDTNGLEDVFLRDFDTGLTSRVSVTSGAVAQSNGRSSFPAISENAEVIVYCSTATNLTADADTNGNWDLFAFERSIFQVKRLTNAFNGGQCVGGDTSSPAITPDGRYVTYYSKASNLVPGDTNGVDDVFVTDRLTGQTERVSVSSSGSQGFGDRCWYPSISGDGRYVVFYSNSTNLVTPPTNAAGHVFLHDRVTHETSLVSKTSSGGVPTGTSARPFISEDGGLVAFHSWAADLVPGDVNSQMDAFVFDRQTQITELVSRNIGGSQGDDGSWNIAISGDGRFVAYSSLATNLVPADTNALEDAFVTQIRGIAPCLPCDANCDGSANLFDAEPFVTQIGEHSDGCSECAGDTNDDGSVNLFDIEGFIECLSG